MRSCAAATAALARSVRSASSRSSSATRVRSLSTSACESTAAPDTASNVAGTSLLSIGPMPRLIEATGERIVPWARDAQVIYEHYHRYLWTRPLVAGRRVLDLGSGEGYGAALLAQTASTVTGIDIDERTVAHSQANYPGVDFSAGSATDLSEFPDGAFDAVVAFEMIEHVAEHDQVV